MTQTKKDKWMLLASFLIVAACTVLPAILVQFPSSTVDEFGHLSNAALMTGRNWTDCTHSAEDYYFKYGTAIFYYLPMLIVKAPVLRYSVELIAAALFLALTGPAAYTVAREYLGVKDCVTALLISLISACPCAVLFQSNYARADWALVATAWIVLFALLKASNAATRRSRILYTVLASAVAVYAYMCHTRGIVTVIALFLTVLLCRLLFHIRALHLIAYGITTAVMLLADRFLTKYFLNAIWGTYGRGHSAVESVDFESLKRILTPSGFKIFVKAVIGWFYSCSTYTCGLLMLGFVLVIVILFTGIAKRKQQPYAGPELLTAMFGSLNFAGNLVLGILYFYNWIYKNLTGASHARADRVLYERYMICTVGILCCAAVCFMIRKNGIRRGVLIASLLFQAGCVVLGALSVFPVFDRQKTNTKLMVSVTTFYSFFEKHSTALLAAGLFGIAVFVLWILLMKMRRTKAALILIIAVFLVTFSMNWYRERYKHGAKIGREMAPAIETVMKVYDLWEEYPDLFVAKGAHVVETYQPLFPDYNVINTRIDRYAEIPDMLLIARGRYGNPERWTDLYTFDDVDYGALEKKDVVYVKGDRLKEALEERGYSLSPYEAAFDNSGE